MKNLLFLFSFFFISFFSFSQNPFTLTKSISFGLNHHTNRDYPNFSVLDKEKNQIIIGTTERDSTFNDVLVTKLDENYNLIWQKTSSISTSLSYEIPLKVFTNTNGDVYVFGASKTNSTKIYGILFYIKYDKHGNELLKKTIGKIDGSDYHDFGYFDIEKNNDDTFNLVYSPHTYRDFGSNEFKFLKIDVNGNANELFTKEIINQGIKGKIENNMFYFISRKLNNPDNIFEGYEHSFLKIDINGNENLLSINNRDFHNYYHNNNYEIFKLNLDNDKNLYITTLNQSDNETKGKINISLIDKDNLLKFVLTTDSNKKYYLIDSFINSSNKLVIVANDLDTDKLVFLSVDDTNQIITLKEIDAFLGTGFKLNKDGTFFITTSNSNIRLFSGELIEINSFNTSNTYNLVDFSKINDNTITSLGAELNKMYPESDDFSQMNIISEKLTKNNIEKKYFYSGEGTSKVLPSELLIDNNNNYIVFSEELLGPAFDRGSNPEKRRRILKYNFDLNLLWEYVLPKGYRFSFDDSFSKNHITDSNGDIYFKTLYTDPNIPRIPSVYRLLKISSEGRLIFEKDFENIRGIVFNNKNILLYSSAVIDNESKYNIHSVNSSTGEIIETSTLEFGQNYKYYIDVDKNIYTYFYNSGNRGVKKILLYKNLEKVYIKETDIKDGESFNYGSLIINNKGDLLFSSNYTDTYKIKLHKLSLNKDYLSKEIGGFSINKILLLGSGKLFTLDSKNNLKVFNSDFSLFSENYINNYYQTDQFINNNTIYINARLEGKHKVFDQNLNLINEYESNIDFNNLIKDLNNNYIFLKEKGNQIYLNPHYSWTRGFLSKYKFNSTLSIEGENSFNNKNLLNIFPNPTKNLFTINLKNNTLKKVNIYSINGQLLYTSFTNKINLSNYSKGLYLLKIYTQENTIINSKIIKN